MDTQENKTENQKNKIIVFLKEHWVLLTICILPLIIYFGNFGGNGISGETGNWGTFGDYFGGIVGTILAFGAFMLMKETLEVQKNELNAATNQFEKQTEIFNQQQFETTFFSLIKLITETKYNNKKTYTVEYQLAMETMKYIINYNKKNNSDIKKYINILKSLLNTSTLLNLALVIKSNNYENLKTFVENHAFFEFIDEIYFDSNNKSSVDYKKAEIETLLYFDISAFGDNIHYQRKVSQSEYVTNDFLDKILAVTPHYEIKINIAGNPKTNPDTLSKLFDNEYHNFEIIAAIAGNSSTPLDILNNICDNIDNIIKNHCNTTKCDKKDHHPRIHNALAKNCHTDIELLKDISNENKDFIKRLCEENITKLFDYYIKKFNDDIENNKNIKNKLHTIIDNYKNDFSKTKELCNNFLIELKKIKDNDREKIINDIIGKTDDGKQKDELYTKYIKYYISDLETIIKKIEEKLK